MYTALISAATKMDSDFEMVSTLLAIYDSMPQDDTSKNLMKDAADSISSDFERQKLLRKLQ
ncbi:hypothetical protein [Kordiimonas sediminis]|nr:hypothetical protein [Kordiimonas sediminis]